MLTLNHPEPVAMAAWSPDDRRLATCSHKQARVWDVDDLAVETSAPIHVLEHLGPVECARFSPDGELLATASADFGVRIWRADTGQLAALGKGHMAAVLDVLWSPDGQRVVSASRDGSLCVFSLGGARRHRLRPHPDGCYGIARVAGTGWQVAAACGDGSVRIWDLDAGELAAELRGVPKPEGWYSAPASLHPSPDGQWLAVAARETLQLWQLSTRTMRVAIEVPALRAPSLAWLPDGERFCICHTDRAEYALMSVDGEKLQSRVGHHAPVRALATLGSEGVLTAGEDGRVVLWTGDEVEGVGACHRGHVEHVVAGGREQRFASIGSDATVIVWQREDLAPPRPAAPGLAPDLTATALYELPHEAVISVRVLPDGRVATGGMKQLKLWRREELVADLEVEAAVNLELSPDGTRLLACAGYQHAALFDLANDRKVADVAGDRVYFSPDGALLVAPNTGQSCVRLLDANTGELHAALESCGSYLNIQTVSPDGRRLVYGGRGRDELCLVDLARATTCAELPGHGDNTIRAAFAPDGRRLATCGRGFAYLWHGDDGRRLATLGEGGAHWCWVLWRDATQLVTAFDHQVDLWTAEGDHVGRMLDTEETLHQVLLSPCGRYVFAGGDCGTAYIVHLATGEILSERLHTNAGGAWSPSGDRLVIWARTDPWQTRMLELIDPASGVVAVLLGHARNLRSQSGERLSSVHFSASGDRLVTIMFNDTRPRLWRCSDGALRAVLGPHSNDVRGVAFSYDQRLVFTAGGSFAAAWDALEGRDPM